MAAKERKFNDVYQGEYLDHVAFPLGGMGAGMFCLEGTGAFSHFSVRNRPDIFHEPMVFSAVCILGRPNVARVLEGPVPAWKISGLPRCGTGCRGKTYGLPRFSSAVFQARFPFARVRLEDRDVPLRVELTGWSPFIPGDADNSGLPGAALEYRFRNPGRKKVEAVYSFNAANFMAAGDGRDSISPKAGGFILLQAGSREKPWNEGAFCVTAEEAAAEVNCAWFRGGWFDSILLAWKDVEGGRCYRRQPVKDRGPAPGATIFVPFSLGPEKEKTIRLLISWYVPKTNLRCGSDTAEQPPPVGEGNWEKEPRRELSTYVPWYAGKFPGIDEVHRYWREKYGSLRRESEKFSECFQDTTLPPEAVEAASANLSILKSPTILRQTDGRLWAWEGCRDEGGCCPGSCSHVWLYAQALPHLFPDLERGLQETAFGECQNDEGHQDFRAALPIRPTFHRFHAAADGQLGGIMRVYRDWRISGDAGWLKRLWPRVKAGLDYCIRTWDPEGTGILVEPHHNTADVEFWGPDPMCSGFYLGALKAAAEIGAALDETDDAARYAALLEKGRKYFEQELFNGEYFFQKTRWEGLRAGNPAATKDIEGKGYSPEAVELLRKEGPKYQYGEGCLSLALSGVWLAVVCGLGEIVDRKKIRSCLRAVYRYNFKRDLFRHTNTQRPGFALGREGGLVLCTWPRGGRPSLPTPYVDEVITGIEYQVAAHMIMEGMTKEGLEIVRTCRRRYDGRRRNPFAECECGCWYARALSSYALLPAMTGSRYDAVEKTLYLRSGAKSGFRAFLAVAGGWGTIDFRKRKPLVKTKFGRIEIRRVGPEK